MHATKPVPVATSSTSAGGGGRSRESAATQASNSALPRAGTLPPCASYSGATVLQKPLIRSWTG